MPLAKAGVMLSAARASAVAAAKSPREPGSELREITRFCPSMNDRLGRCCPGLRAIEFVHERQDLGNNVIQLGGNSGPQVQPRQQLHEVGIWLDIYPVLAGERDDLLGQLASPRGGDHGRSLPAAPVLECHRLADGSAALAPLLAGI